MNTFEIGTTLFNATGVTVMRSEQLAEILDALNMVKGMAGGGVFLLTILVIITLLGKD